MMKLENIKPVGYANASFLRSDDQRIYVSLSHAQLDNDTIALYGEDGQWIVPKTASKDSIAYEDIIAVMQTGKSYSFCVIKKQAEQVEATYLRNTNIVVQEIYKERMYDRRALYGTPQTVDKYGIVLPFYKANQIMAVTKIAKPEAIYASQFQNEIIFTEMSEENAELCHVFTKCKRIEGNYVGLVHENALTQEDLLSHCIEYLSSEVNNESVYLDYYITAEASRELDKYYTVWTHQGNIYYAPLAIKQTPDYMLITDVQYVMGKGLQFSIEFDEKQYGKYRKLKAVNMVEEWEKPKNTTVEELSNVCEAGVRKVRYELKTTNKLKGIGSWYLCVHTEKDGMKHKTPVALDAASYVKEFYDKKDTKYKLVFDDEDGMLIIQRTYGHNVLLNKNIQAASDISIEKFLKAGNFSLKGNMYAEYAQSKDALKIKFYQNLEDVIEAKLVMYNTQNLGILCTQDLDIVDGRIQEIIVDTPDIDWDHKFAKPVNSVWARVCIALRNSHGVFFSALTHYDLDTTIERDGHLYDSRKLHLNPIGHKPVCDIEMEALPYYTEKKLLSMKFVRPEQVYRSQFTNELLDVRIKNDIMTVKMRCRDCGFAYKGVLMEYRKVKEDDAESYLIPYTSLKKEHGWYIMTTHIDMKKYYMRMLYWDIRCAFEVDGRIYTVSCHSNNEKFLRKYKGVFVDRTYPNDNSILFPYATGNASVALMHRETCPQDHWPFRLKEKIAQIIYKMFKKYWDSQNVYLIFEKYCTMAQDNGYFFFKYCMDANVENTFDGRIFYVIEKEASDWNKVVPYKDHVLPYLSLRHMIYLQACKLLISTDTKGHAYVWRSMGSDIKALSYKKKLVFLQHGVTAFKRGHFERGTNVGCEYFITTSQFEHDIIHNYLEYPEDEIPITGFARWDVLHDKSEGHREILMMPTWRTWLDDAENDIFAESDYCKNYMALLNDPRLDDILDKYNVTLNFYIHPKFRKFISEFSVVSEHIRLIPFGEEPLNELMMQCNLLITDFSSVAWDVYYMNKPVLFYHFDIEVEAKTLGFYMDMEKDIFGERAMEPEELMQLIIEYIENGFVMKEKYSKDREKYFAYVDDNNSERIWAAIQEREW